jgi:hypothetical protein
VRTIVLVAILAGTSWSATPAAAGTWCGTFRLGSTSCGYSSSEACHGARPWGILLPESIPRHRLRDLRRELERARRAKAQSARLLERVSGYRDAEAMGHRM